MVCPVCDGIIPTPLTDPRDPHIHTDYCAHSRRFGHESGDWERRGLTPRVVEEVFTAAEQRRAEGVRITLLASFLEIYLDRTRDLGRAYRSMKMAAGDLVGTDGSRPLRGSQARSAFAHRPSSVKPTARAYEVTHTRPSSARDPRLSIASGDSHYASQDLPLLEDSSGNVVVRDLTVIEVESAKEVMAMINAGLALRQTHSTTINDVSSRSHTVFRLTVVQQRSSGSSREATSGQLNLVDLAGSERLKKSESAGQRRLEAQYINTSLTHLGKVVLKLTEARAAASIRGTEQAAQARHIEDHIPYRDSKLTRILKNALGRNSITVLLAALNPSDDNHEESLNTLQFASRCMGVQNAPVINYVSLDEEDASSNAKGQVAAISELQMEVEQLTSALVAAGQDIDALHVHYERILEAVPAAYLPSAAKQPPPSRRMETRLLETVAAAAATNTSDDHTHTGAHPLLSAARRLAPEKRAGGGVGSDVGGSARGISTAEEQALRDALREALEKCTEAERQREEEARAGAAALAAEREEAAEELAKAREAAASAQSTAEAEAKGLRQRVTELTTQVSSVLRSMPDAVSSALAANGETAAAAAAAAQATAEEWSAKLRAAEEAKRTSLANVKAQAQYFVDEKERALVEAQKARLEAEGAVELAEGATASARREAKGARRQAADATEVVAASARLLGALAEGCAALEAVGVMPTSASGGPGISSVLRVAAKAVHSGKAADMDVKTRELGSMLEAAVAAVPVVCRAPGSTQTRFSSRPHSAHIHASTSRPAGRPLRTGSAVASRSDASGSDARQPSLEGEVDLLVDEDQRADAALVKANADAQRYRVGMEAQRRRAHDLKVAIDAKDRLIAKLQRRQAPVPTTARGSQLTYSVVSML